MNTRRSDEVAARRTAAKAYDAMAALGHHPFTGVVASGEVARETYARRAVAEAKENGLTVPVELGTAFFVTIEAGRLLACGDRDVAARLLDLARRELRTEGAR